LSHDVSEILIGSDEIRRAVGRLAAEVDRDLDGRPGLLVGVLKGGAFFLCDLARAMRSPVAIDFLRVSSYGAGTRSSGNVQVVHDLSVDIAGKDVVLVEDIVDSGATLAHILELLATRKPRTLKVCTMLRKNLAGARAVPVDYVGFEIEDRFVVGYGLDFAESYRNLPHVAVLREEKDG
jgi:hypoxanthine phosphoribosyltransferase